MGSGDRPGLQIEARGLPAFVFRSLDRPEWCTKGAVWACLSLIVQPIVQ
jgi:hypothetical protein